MKKSFWLVLVFFALFLVILLGTAFFAMLAENCMNMKAGIKTQFFNIIVFLNCAIRYLPWCAVISLMMLVLSIIKHKYTVPQFIIPYFILALFVWLLLIPGIYSISSWQSLIPKTPELSLSEDDNVPESQEPIAVHMIVDAVNAHPESFVQEENAVQKIINAVKQHPESMDNNSAIQKIINAVKQHPESYEQVVSPIQKIISEVKTHPDSIEHTEQLEAQALSQEIVNGPASESDKPSTGYFRKDGEYLTYQTGTAEDDGDLWERKVFTEKTGEEVSSEYMDSLIESGISVPSWGVFVYQKCMLLKNVCRSVLNKGYVWYLLFATMGLALSSVVFLCRFSSWRLVNALSVMLVFAIIVIGNAYYYEMFLHGKFPTLEHWWLPPLVINVLICVIFMMVGIFNWVRHPDRNREGQ